jgi:hypothetical protein
MIDSCTGFYTVSLTAARNQSPDTRIPSQINHVKKCELRCTRVVRNVDSRPALIGESILIGLSVSRVNISSSLGERNPCATQKFRPPLRTPNLN